MATQITKTFGPGRDFTTDAQVQAYVNSLDLVVLDQNVKILLYAVLTYLPMGPISSSDSCRVMFTAPPGASVNDLNRDTLDVTTATTGAKMVLPRNQYGTPVGPGMDFFDLILDIPIGWAQSLEFTSRAGQTFDHKIKRCRVLNRCTQNGAVFRFLGKQDFTDGLVIIEGGAAAQTFYDDSFSNEVKRMTFVARGASLNNALIAGAQYLVGSKLQDSVLINCGGNLSSTGIAVSNCYTNAAVTAGQTTGFTVVTGAAGLVTNESNDFRPSDTGGLIGTGSVSTNSTVDILSNNRGLDPDVGSWEKNPIVAVPVSFTGPVPTRNGTEAAVASFSNAGFFSGNALPFTYSVLAGILPAGLTLNSSTGVIAGTPTVAGTQSGVVIRATDGAGNTADTNAYSIVIAAANFAPTFPGVIANLTGNAGPINPVNVSGQFSDVDALAFTPAPTGTVWPAGLVINSTTGVISGSVAEGTTANLRVRATDTIGQTVDSNSFSITISAAQVVGGSFVSDVLTSSGTIRKNQACTVTWFAGGAVGSFTGTPVHSSRTTSVAGQVTIPGLPVGPGYLLVRFGDGGICYQEGSVT